MLLNAIILDHDFDRDYGDPGEGFDLFGMLLEFIQRLTDLYQVMYDFLTYEFEPRITFGFLPGDPTLGPDITLSVWGILGGVGFTVLIVAVILKWIVPVA